MEILMPSPLREYSPFGQGGKDWFGCLWEWDEASFSHAPDVRKPPLIEDTHQVIDTFAPGGNLLFQCYISNMECMGNSDIINQEARIYGADYSRFHKAR
jgi:hypothetical protein